jgi:hypothetical protein
LLDTGIGNKVNEKFIIDENSWYKQRVWLDAFKELSTKLGDMSLLQIGMRIPENAKFPPWI